MSDETKMKTKLISARGFYRFWILKKNIFFWLRLNLNSRINKRQMIKQNLTRKVSNIHVVRYLTLIAAQGIKIRKANVRLWFDTFGQFSKSRAFDFLSQKIFSGYCRELSWLHICYWRLEYVFVLLVVNIFIYVNIIGFIVWKRGYKFINYV